ncbi:MAG TPA: zinc-binding alcohol dehydrogenase [Terracidiphilus sp.]|jgi:threonine dehydrogenase-like Zn-dependent dehydrogenase|nr:zinc-binding alcohol dehydrogenase [Terracidiphilus sp.]
MLMPMLAIHKAMLYGAGDLRIEEELFDPSVLKPGDALVRTVVSGFSTGTDLGNYEGRSTEVPGAPDYPRGVGYSNVGVVELVNGGEGRLRPGDHVFSMRSHCSFYTASQSDLLVSIPAGVDLEQASLAYLTHLGVAGMRRVHYETGEDVAVVGLGVIGLCTLAIARAMGARVAAIANDERRAELARQLGAHEVHLSGKFDPARVFDGRGADVVVLTANPWQAYRDSVEMARMGGRIAVLGFPGRAQEAVPFNPLDMQWLYGKQLTIAGAGYLPFTDCPPSEIRFNVRRDLEFVLNCLASGTMNLAPIISHRFPFQRMREAYELAKAHSKQLSAAVFLWNRANSPDQ